MERATGIMDCGAMFFVVVEDVDERVDKRDVYQEVDESRTKQVGDQSWSDVEI